MKGLQVALAALALTGCSSPAPTRTVEINGAPEDVARFVAAEKGRDGPAEVAYRTGETRAVFSVPTSRAQSEMSERAAAARLAVVTESTNWSFGSDS